MRINSSTLLTALVSSLFVASSLGTDTSRRPHRYHTRRQIQSTTACSSQLGVCRDEFEARDNDLDDLMLQALATRQVDDIIKEPLVNTTAKGGGGFNPFKILEGVFYQVAGEDNGPLASIGYFLAEGGDLKNVLGLLNPLEVADSVLAQWVGEGNPLLTFASTTLNRLFPEFSLETIFAGGGDDGDDDADDDTDLETTLTELRSLVATAKTKRKIEDPERRVPSLIRRLVGSIFFLAPKDLADILSLPFVLVAKRRRVDGDAVEEEEDDTGIVGQLLGVPVVVLSTRYVIARLFPDLLLTDLIPDLPFLNGLVPPPTRCGQEGFEQFANETMEELRIILADSNATNTSGLFEDAPEVGQSALEIVQGFAKVEAITLANFIDDPVITAIRLAVAGVLASTAVVARLSSIHLPTTTAILTGVLTTVGLNATETLPFFTRLVGIPIIGIVAEGFPPLKNLLDGVDAIASNVLQVVFPNALGELQTVVSDNFAIGGGTTNSPFGQFFSGFGCKIALASCSARTFLSNALNSELQKEASDNATEVVIGGGNGTVVENTTETESENDPTLVDLVTEEAKAAESGAARPSSVRWTIAVAAASVIVSATAF